MAGVILALGLLVLCSLIAFIIGATWGMCHESSPKEAVAIERNKPIGCAIYNNNGTIVKDCRVGKYFDKRA